MGTLPSFFKLRFILEVVFYEIDALFLHLTQIVTNECPFIYLCFLCQNGTEKVYGSSGYLYIDINILSGNSPNIQNTLYQKSDVIVYKSGSWPESW